MIRTAETLHQNAERYRKLFLVDFEMPAKRDCP